MRRSRPWGRLSSPCRFSLLSLPFAARHPLSGFGATADQETGQERKKPLNTANRELPVARREFRGGRGVKGLGQLGRQREPGAQSRALQRWFCGDGAALSKDQDKPPDRLTPARPPFRTLRPCACQVHNSRRIQTGRQIVSRASARRVRCGRKADTNLPV